jgi:endonuclease/exonuclease/phosphatase family metal-dependent hydrolase
MVRTAGYTAAMRQLLLSALVAGLVACGGASPAPPTTPPPATLTIPRQGTTTTLDVATWNLEWFGDTGNGPANEPLQQSNVQQVIAGADIDIWGVQEVVDRSAWTALLAKLPGYAGVLADDAAVIDGASYYSDFGDREQKVGVVYRTAAATVTGARVILGANDFDFAGRPPLEVRMTTTVDGVATDVVVIVLHMKAFDDTVSWTRRRNAGSALKAYLDATYPTQQVIVLGDWNDDVDVSITAGRPSPYATFVADAVRYAYPTKALSDARVASTVGYPDLIDHHLATNEMMARYVAGSAAVFRLDAVVPSYDATTTDHFPVVTRFHARQP